METTYCTVKFLLFYRPNNAIRAKLGAAREATRRRQAGAHPQNQSDRLQHGRPEHRRPPGQWRGGRAQRPTRSGGAGPPGSRSSRTVGERGPHAGKRRDHVGDKFAGYGRWGKGASS